MGLNEFAVFAVLQRIQRRRWQNRNDYIETNRILHASQFLTARNNFFFSIAVSGFISDWGHLIWCRRLSTSLSHIGNL